MTEKRRQRFKQVLDRRQSNLTVVLENVLDEHNIAAVLRTCDAVGVGEVHVLTHGLAHCKLGNERKFGRKSSAGAMKWLKVRYHEDVGECLEVVRGKYGRILCTHLGAEARSLYELDLTQPTALFFGNEQQGVSAAALALCDGNFSIPQVGMVQSLNISVACAVSLYEASRQRLAAGMYQSPMLGRAEYSAIFDGWCERDVNKG